MSYVDSDYYKQHCNVIIDDIDNKLEKASDQIDSITFNRIVGTGFSNLTEFQQNKIKKAVCLQADFMEQYGEYINMPLSGYKAGSISMTINNHAVKNVNGVTTSNEVYNLLMQTGLTCLSFNYRRR